MFLFKGYSLINVATNYYMFNSDIQFQDFVEREQKYSCKNGKKNESVFCQKLNEQ